MTDQPMFQEAGRFLKAKRKQAGFRTQRNFIDALLDIDPEISCSESYISLIEKGVKTPAVYLLGIMAQVLGLTAGEKGELLLTYKRVPSDFEYAVRDNLREAAQLTRLEKIRQLYEKEPNQTHFKQLIQALILESQEQEAMDLLKKTPTFENELFEMQLRTACIASISGNETFAKQAFELALNNAHNATDRAEVLIDLGSHTFQLGLKAQDKQDQDIYQALDYYVQAMSYFQESLAISPNHPFASDEQTRCAYHLGDGLCQLQKQKKFNKAPKEFVALNKAFAQWFEKKADARQMQGQSQIFFKQALEGYASTLANADTSPLPDKPIREAVYFYSYTHAKLKLFRQARVLLNANLILDRNWLIWFMKACLEVLEYQDNGHDHHLDAALVALAKAMEYDADTVRYQVRLERERELDKLWQLRVDDVEALLKQA